MSEKSERKISSEKLYEGKIISLYVDEVKCPNGDTALREYVKHPGGVCVLPIIDNKVIMERQYRYVYGKDIFELPAGKIEKGEKPEIAAIRELEEETGYSTDKLISLGEIYPSVGYTDEIIRLFLATDLKKTKRHLDEDEFIDLDYVPIEVLENQIKNGEIRDAKTVVAVLKYLQFTKK